jgi:ubiquinone/menaquinone biosynthesis C-methylase UbiE
LLTEAGLVALRKDGRRSFYALCAGLPGGLDALVASAAKGASELPERESDLVNLRRVLALREERAQAYFNHVAGRFDRIYGPGRSWQALGHLLLRMLPPLDVADLGSGEGLVAELLAHRCRRVIAVDNSERMVEFGTRKARQNGMTNLEFRLGDIMRPPVADASVDVAILSHALHHADDPAQAVRAAHRILRPGGQVLVLDLVQHRFEQARERYGDRWLGFASADLQRWLEQAGFVSIEVSVVSREDEPPHFETLLAAGVKTGADGTRGA